MKRPFFILLLGIAVLTLLPLAVRADDIRVVPEAGHQEKALQNMIDLCLQQTKNAGPDSASAFDDCLNSSGMQEQYGIDAKNGAQESQAQDTYNYAPPVQNVPTGQGIDETPAQQSPSSGGGYFIHSGKNSGGAKPVFLNR